MKAEKLVFGPNLRGLFMPATSHIILRSARWTKLAAQSRQEDRGRLLRWGDGGIFKRPEDAKLEERTEAAEDGGDAAEDDGEPFEEKMQRLTAEPGGGTASRVGAAGGGDQG